MNYQKGILFMFFGLLSFQPVKAQDAKPLPPDSMNVAMQDTMAITDAGIIKKHIPAKATMFSAVLPGLGQIYNKKYWKVPIVYGGFIGLGITVNNYNQYYLDFKKAYFDLNDNDPSTQFYEKLYEGKNYDFSERNKSQINTMLTDRIDELRRQRDLMIIITAGFYLLNVLDANVDAHFIDFDISEDLTVQCEPVFIDPLSSSPVIGARLVYTF